MVAYIGCREGWLLRIDFRKKGHDKVFTTNHMINKGSMHKNITSILALNDGYTLATSHVSGLVRHSELYKLLRVVFH